MGATTNAIFVCLSNMTPRLRHDEDSVIVASPIVAYQSEKTNVKRKSQETQFCHPLSSVCLILSMSECH